MNAVKFMSRKRCSGCKEQGEKGVGRHLMGAEFQLCKVKRFMDLDGVDGYTTV